MKWLFWNNDIYLATKKIFWIWQEPPSPLNEKNGQKWSNMVKNGQEWIGHNPPLFWPKVKKQFFYASHKCGHLHLDLTDETFHGPYNEER